jgi:hypothetical protein
MKNNREEQPKGEHSLEDSKAGEHCMFKMLESGVLYAGVAAAAGSCAATVPPCLSALQCSRGDWPAARMQFSKNNDVPQP